MIDFVSRIAALLSRQDGAFCKRRSRCADDSVLAIARGVGVLGNLCARVEVRSVLMNQSMGVNLVAVLVAANLDPNVAAIHARSTKRRRDFIHRKRNALEPTTPVLKRAAIGEFANR